MISLTGGRWKGRKIKALNQEGLRPSSSRVKESIFHILESLRMKQNLEKSFIGWRVLDLFSGIGGLGIEALSRDADFCLFVEKNKRSHRTLKDNLDSLGVSADRAVALCEDAFRHQDWSAYGKYALVLLDPPYTLKESQKIFDLLIKSDALEPGAILLWEHDAKWVPETNIHFSLLSQRKIGPAGVSLFSYNPSQRSEL